LPKLLELYNKVTNYWETHVDKKGAPYKTFAFFVIINYLISLLILCFSETQMHEIIGLRLIACILCIPLLLHSYLPQRVKKILPFYWHLVLFYCIPFFGTIMLWRNSFSLEWILNLSLGLFLFLLLSDYITFAFFICLGFFLGSLVHKATGGSFVFAIHNSSNTNFLFLNAYLFLYAVIIGSILTPKKIISVKQKAMKIISYPVGLINKLALASQKRVDKFGAQYRTFSIFTIINYPISFIILFFLESQQNESLWLRLIACILCLPLLFHDSWPDKIRYYLPIYWHLSVLYCLPFFATIMLLRNALSSEWLLNMLLGFFLFILLVDWLTFLVLLSLGVLLGGVFYTLMGGSFEPLLNLKFDSSFSLIFYLYFYAVIIGALFARNREKINEVKMEALKSLAYSIAHEMRTPLASIAAGASNLGRFLPIFERGYLKATDAGLMEPEIHPKQLSQIKDTPAIMERVSYNAQNIIDMLLMKVRRVEAIELVPCSMSNCIQTALEQYPLRDKERAAICWDKNADFLFLGKKEMLLHVFFNLLKNSLHQVSAVKNGRINIWISTKETQNFLHFQDNGNGISKKILTNIFDRFISGTEFGTGMGLAYCKMAMNSFGGDITCRSTEGQGAEFILNFPLIGRSWPKSGLAINPNSNPMELEI
jgi:signal transduction histidine kinase